MESEQQTLARAASLSGVGLHTGEEIISDKSGKKFCGMLIFMFPVAGVAFLSYAINCAYTREDPLKDMALSTVCLLFIIFGAMGCHYLNRRWIARG